MKDDIYKSQQLLVMEKHKADNLQLKLIKFLRILPMAAQENVHYPANVTAERHNFSVTKTFPFRKFQRQSIQSHGTGMLLSAYTNPVVTIFKQQRAQTLKKALCISCSYIYAISTERDYQGRLLKETLNFCTMQFCQNTVNCIKNALMVTEG